MIQDVLKFFFGSKHERDIKKLEPIIKKISSKEEEWNSISDDNLTQKRNEFKERITRGETLESILPEAFACVRLAAVRALGLRHYDVQMMGGIVLHNGSIAEMKTGEGKTLTSTLPIYLNALSGDGVHVITVNDYLAERDSEWMKPVFTLLGLSTGCITSNMPHTKRKEAYSKDVTYGTNNEFGFDYLRDNMVEHISQKVQRSFNFAIVDEVDSILIDEARTPLIISGPSEENVDGYIRVNKIIHHLNDKDDFDIDEKSKSILLTEIGVAKVEQLLSNSNLYEPHNVDLVHHIQQALKAHHLFNKDVDYVVRNGEVVIVDEFTGRFMEGRRYSDGLHQAIEAKEKVDIRQENQTLATITFQNYFRLYKKLSGMTGTADTEAEEFKKIYKLDVVVLPTHQKMIRLDKPDRIYRTKNEKFEAITKDVKECYLNGQPVLIGTVSIENSELLAKSFKKSGIPHSILNAKFHDKEADIIKNAGYKGKVTIATNMAGRGTDIVLGEGVKELGGLYIIGSERHESRRIDNQLRGRSGRQGDPGESCFYLSLEDDLMRIFGSDKIGPIMQRLGMKEGESIEHKMVSNAIERSQKRVESHHFDIRKHLLEFDDVMNKQRTYIYKLRNHILESGEINNLIDEFISDSVSHSIEEYLPQEKTKNWNFEGLVLHIESLLGETFPFTEKEILNSDIEKTQQWFLDKIAHILKEKEKNFGAENYRLLEKIIALQVIDQKWKEHLYSLDHIREGIWTVGYANKNQLDEYRLQSFLLFESVLSTVKEEITTFLIKSQIKEPLEEEIPSEYRSIGEGIHSSSSSYGAGANLQMDNMSSTSLPILGNSTKSSQGTKIKSSGGDSKRKSTRRQNKKYER